jgi:homeobox protein cut-like
MCIIFLGPQNFMQVFPFVLQIFGEVVLGLSQGSVSELLSKPKPWHMLSIKGREPFIRMQLWLTDPNNVERLQQMKSERREANKRRRTTTGTNGPTDNSSDTSSNDTAEFYHAPTGSPGPPSAKKQRVLFSEEQKEALRLAFALDPYPNMATIEFLANELNLAARTITNWFHNHRMRLKQTLPHGNNNNETQQPPPNQPSQQNSSSTFDPSHFRLLLSQRLTEIHKERGGGAMPPFPFFNPSVAAMVSPSSGGPMPPLPPLPPLPPQHLLMAAAMREQLSGLDLSMTSLKKEESDGEDDDNSADSDDSNLSADFSSHHRMPPVPAAAPVRSASRRKPAAPQWVNPEWQADEKEKDDAKDSPPAIINGVCVMQTDNFESCLMRRTAEVDDDDTVRIEPTAAPEALVAARAEKESSDVEDEDGVGADDEAPSTTTLELGVSASAASAPETSVSAVDDVAEDWEQKIDDADEPDKRMKVQDGGEDWEF